MHLADRLLTIAVTATLTSAAWIVIGTTYVDRIDPAPTPTALPVPSEATASRPEGPSPSAASQSGSLLIPVEGIAATQLADTFDDQRGDRRHEAIDIMAPAGTPVIAAARGRVEKLFKSDAGGNTVYVRSPDRRTLHYYAHLRAYAPGLSEGREVERGQRIGTVGATGNADPATPHLHFAVMRTARGAQWWEPARAINPYPLLVAQTGAAGS